MLCLMCPLSDLLCDGTSFLTLFPPRPHRCNSVVSGPIRKIRSSDVPGISYLGRLSLVAMVLRGVDLAVNTLLPSGAFNSGPFLG